MICALHGQTCFNYEVDSVNSHHTIPHPIHTQTPIHKYTQGEMRPMMCGGGVSIYYTTQSTYNNPLPVASDSGRSHFFHSDLYVDMFRQGHQTGLSKWKEKKLHRYSQPISHTKIKQCQQTTVNWVKNRI